VVLTSANAVHALDRYRDLPVYVVGSATADAARARGARALHVAAGDWQSLTRLLASAEGPPPGARLLHLSGAVITGDLAGAAAAAGFAYARHIVYAARPVQWLSRPTLALLAAGELDAVLFFSPAHATIWRRLIDRAAARDRLFPLRAVVLSTAVAAAVAGLPWRQIAVADAPEQARLIERLEAIGG